MSTISTRVASTTSKILVKTIKPGHPYMEKKLEISQKIQMIFAIGLDSFIDVEKERKKLLTDFLDVHAKYETSDGTDKFNEFWEFNKNTGLRYSVQIKKEAPTK